jgi:hypothetical protein
MATYYVRPGGNNGNAGTGISTGEAWATISYALGASSPVTSGDTVYIAPGIYRQTAIITLSKSLSSTLTVAGDTTGVIFGVASGEVRMTTYPSESAFSTQTQLLNVTANNVTFNNITFELGGNSDAYVVNSRGRNHTFFKCVFIHGLPSNSGSSGGLFGTSQNGTTTNRLINSCIFVANRGVILQVTSGGFSGTTIRDSLFLTSNYGFYQTTGASQSGTDTSLFTNNTVLGACTGAAIRTDDGAASGLTVQNNLFIANFSASTCLQTGGASQNTFIIEDYNRIIGFSVARSSVASIGANTTVNGTQGVDYGSILQGYTMVPFASNRSTSSNISFGRTANAPTVDMLGTSWTGGIPDAGSITYKSLAGALLTHPGMTGGIRG